MTSHPETPEYYDLKKTREDKTDFFFLENILKARIGLNIPTGTHEGEDENTNVYLAGVLQSAMTSGEVLKEKPYISPYDVDIRHYLDAHPGASTEYVVYKDNADFGLVSVSVFMGYSHPGSYYHRTMESTDCSGRISLYYTMAGSTLEHIKGSRAVMASTLNSMGEHIDEVVRIARKVAGDYFDFIGRLSPGSAYHLEREINTRADKAEYEKKLDGFLATFARHRRAPCVETRLEVLRQAGELKRLNPDFSFDEKSLD